MYRVLAVVVSALLWAGPLFADSSALILSSVSGTPEHAERFAKWTEGTRKALVDKFGFSPERVLVLAERKATRDEVRKAFDTLKGQLRPQDTFFLFFIGHGSSDRIEYRFNLTGPDLTATEYAGLIASLGAVRAIVINSTSASGGAIEALSGRNRVVITATRSGDEGNETVFHEHFLGALQDAAADEDKDQKTSVWEAYKYATAAVDRFYKEQNRLITEHPQISDNGGEKAATFKEPPLVARSTAFQVQRAVAVADPKLRELLEERQRIEARIEELRTRKDGMPEAEYEQKMEALLVELALKNQQVREQERKK